MNHILLLTIFLLAFSACDQKRPPRIIDRSFYYWKSSFNPDSKERQVLNDLHIKRLYVKFFDVVWNDAKNEPMPVAIINFHQQQDQLSTDIIPTVFITNDCIRKIKDPQLNAVARKIILLVNHIDSTNNIRNSHEFQLDCDWTAETKDRYFSLLQILRKLLKDQQRLLSVTIRLHQYKYHKKLGVPPVDRGLLMCYNMGNLKSQESRNSIMEVSELKKYIDGVPGYPLPLDIALPLFSWTVLFRNKKFAGIISSLPVDSLKNNVAVKNSGNNYEILQACSIAGYTFQSADILRFENVSFDELVKAEDILNKKLQTPRFSVVLYHLDSITLSKFSTHELETVFDHLR